jgi:G2/mitotic-specific cyclin 3/4
MANPELQSPQHVCYSNYTYTQLLRLLPRIVECCEQPRKHHAQVFQKYADKRYKRVSVFVESEMARGFMLPALTKERASPYAPQYWDPSAWRHL